MLTNILKELKDHSSKERAKSSQRFFKTKKGEYGEGDIFAGISNPDMRKMASKYKDIELKDIKELLKNKIHEYRLLALLILVKQYEKGDEKKKKLIFDIYTKNTKSINNWDLVDLSAPQIVGGYLIDKDRKILYEFAKSNDLWKKRIAVLATFTFIRNNETKDAFNICELLINDHHDLIHKATGWMLREIGKRIGIKEEEKFLKKHYKNMPRTMLRYSIEHFNEDKRKFYMRR